MRHTISRKININSPPDTVWKILTDLESYEKWNPFIVSSKGNPCVGEILVNRMEPPGGKAMTFKPRVTIVEENSVFEWLGSAGIPGIFDGRHRFELKETSSGTQLTHSETFSGLLVRTFRESLDTHTLQGFQAMNEALKVRAEK
jgi:hypothetical protein